MRTCLLFLLLALLLASTLFWSNKNVIFSCLNYFDCKSEHLFFSPDKCFHGILEFQHDKKQTCNMHGAYLNYSEIMGRVHKQLA